MSWLLFLWAALTFPVVSGAADIMKNSDVRVLIDVSGSMKQNDPNNLRIPALRLLVGLLPQGSKAGVWAFGTGATDIVDAGEVTDDWRSQARDRSSQIHSRDLFTNIELALIDATSDWITPDPSATRSIILLTDGFVDVSKDPGQNAISRDRIINRILPRLQNAEATIHAVALSANADHALLQQLTSATSGWFEKVETAKELERVFLRMLETTTNPDTLPLTGNQVRVDATISELTLLIFRSNEFLPARLVQPSGKIFSEFNAPPNVKWHHEAHYDLVTVDAPMRGTWLVDSDPDPDNRVMVVTDLRLHVSEMPHHMRTQEYFPLEIQLSEKGKPLTDAAFLNFMTVKVTQKGTDGKEKVWFLQDQGVSGDPLPGDGIFSLPLGETLTEGEHEFVVLVDGQTFQREHRQRVSVHRTPVMTALNRTSYENKFLLSVVPRANMVIPETLSINAMVTGPDGVKREMTVPRVSTAEWQLEIDTSTAPGAHTLELNVVGSSPDGRSVSAWTDPVAFGETMNPAPPENTDTSDASMAEVTPETQVAETTPPAPEEAPTAWWLSALPWLGANGLAVAAIYLGVRRWRKARARLAGELEDVLA